MKTLFSLVMLATVVGCSAPVAMTYTDETAMEACVSDCQRMQTDCHIAGYPSNGRTCEQACVGLTYASPVNAAHFCMEDIEINHFVACESCLFGDTSDGVCDFSSQFDPAGRCYAVCQPNHDDVTFCGHVGN